MRKLNICAALAAVALVGFGIMVADGGKTNNVIVLKYDSDNCFLTISNRPYVQLGDGSIFVVRVTDSEWRSITNHFPDNIKTNPISFCD